LLPRSIPRIALNGIELLAYNKFIFRGALYTRLQPNWLSHFIISGGEVGLEVIIVSLSTQTYFDLPLVFYSLCVHTAF